MCLRPTGRISSSTTKQSSTVLSARVSMKMKSKRASFGLERRQHRSEPSTGCREVEDGEAISDFTAVQQGLFVKYAIDGDVGGRRRSSGDAQGRLDRPHRQQHSENSYADVVPVALERM